MESGTKVINKPLKSRKIYNGEIDFWKLIFAFVIVILHYRLLCDNPREAFFKSGQVAVEFFFVVSGYFMMQSADSAALKYDGVKGHSIWKENLGFIWRKIKGILPYHLLGFAFAFTVWSVDYITSPGYTVYNYCKAALKNVWSLLLFQSSGVNEGKGLNNVTWYISAMLFVMLVLYPIIRKHRDAFVRYIAPIIIFVLLGYISMVHKNLNTTGEGMSRYLTWGVLRGFMAISTGCVIYDVAAAVRKINFSKLASIGLALLELISFAAVLYILNKNNSSDDGVFDSQLNFVVFLFIVIAVTIVFTQKSIISPLFKSRKFKICGTLSTAIYFCHIGGRDIFLNKNYLISYKRELLLGFVISIVCGIACIMIINAFKKNTPTAKRVFSSVCAVACVIAVCFGYYGADIYNDSLRVGVIDDAVQLYEKDIDKYDYLMYAGGSDSEKYTEINSLDVIRTAHKSGERFFQTSVCLTADGVPVLAKNWSKAEIKEKYGSKRYYEKEPVPWYKDFKKWEIYGTYSTTSFEQLGNYMEECKYDMFVLITIDGQDTEKFAKTCEAVAKAVDNDERVLSHIMIQANSKETLGAISESHNYALTNYYIAPEEINHIDSVLSYCRDNKVASVSVDSAYYTQTVADKISASGLDCYVFATDDKDEAEEYLAMGADLVGTNYLRAE